MCQPAASCYFMQVIRDKLQLLESFSVFHDLTDLPNCFHKLKKTKKLSYLLHVLNFVISISPQLWPEKKKNSLWYCCTVSVLYRLCVSFVSQTIYLFPYVFSLARTYGLFCWGYVHAYFRVSLTSLLLLYKQNKVMVQNVMET